MRLYLLLIVVFSFSMADVAGQEFRVISCSGTVQYQKSAQESLAKVVPGQKLVPQGSLKMSDGAKIRILCKDKPHVLIGPGQYELMPLFQSSNRKSMSYTSRFWNFVVDGLKSSDSPNDLKAYHASNLSISGGIKGYSESACTDSTIQWILPISGKVRNSTIPLVYSQSPEQLILSFNSADPIDLNPVESQLDLASMSELMKAEGAVFSLKPHFGSCKLERKLEYVKLGEDEINAKLESISGWDEASEFDRKWMKAVVLEMKGYNTEAYSIYAELLDGQGDHELISRLFNLFLVRNNIQTLIN